MIKRKLKPCKICGKPVFKIGAKVCSINCSLEYNALHPEELKNYVIETHDKLVKQMNKPRKIKSKSEDENAKKEAREAFQLWVRLRDADQPCISCGKNKPSTKWDAGHFKKAEVFRGLIFHPYNCNKQCAEPCNRQLHGNLDNYRLGLINRIGRTNVEALEAIADSLRELDYSRTDLIEIKKFYQAKIKAKDYTNEIFKPWQQQK